MNKVILLFAIAIPVSYTFALICEKLSKQFKVYSKGGFRRNLTPVPLLGGLGIFATLLLMAPAAVDTWAEVIPLLAAVPVVLVGVLDDAKELNAKHKLFFQILAGSIWFFLTPKDHMILSDHVPSYMSYLFSVFWLVGIMNAINMIDGMDGLASGFGALAAIGILFLPGDFERLLVAVFAGACVGFLIRNFSPAKIYLGDSGSHLIGFFLGVNLLQWKTLTPSGNMIFVPLFILAYPEIDAILSMFRRLKAKTSMVVGDREHFHHRFQKVGFSVIETWLVLMMITVGTIWVANNLARIDQPYLVSNVLCHTYVFCSMLFIIFAIWDKFAKRASQVGQSFIQKAFNLQTIPFSEDVGTRAVVLDLFPYYQELQSRGVEHISSFITELSLFFKENCTEKTYYWAVGSYTIVAVEKGPDMNPVFKQEMIKNFFELLDQHNLRKNDTLVPWGLSFYTRAKFNHLALKFDLPTKDNEQKVA